VIGLGLALLGLVTAATLFDRGQSRKHLEQRWQCEAFLHQMAARLERARRELGEPPHYPTCLAELEQLEGRRTPEFKNYLYRVDSDGQTFEILCRRGHGQHWPVYHSRRGLYQGQELRSR